MNNRNTLLAVSIIASSALSFAHADENNMPECWSTPEKCETVTLIDFNGDPATESASMTFSDWNEKIQGGYAISLGEISVQDPSVTSGYSGTYNYQGVRGTTPNRFWSNEEIIVTYKNIGDEPVEFYPFLSFSDSDTAVASYENENVDAGYWLVPTQGTATVYPGGTTQIHFRVSFEGKGYVDTAFINTNINVNDSRQLDVGIDKIEYKRFKDVTFPSCEKNYGMYCNTFTLVDFKPTKQDTLNTMMSHHLNQLLENRQLVFENGMDGVTTRMQTIKNRYSGDAVWNNQHGSYAGIKGDTPLMLEEGDVIRVYYRPNNLDIETLVTPRISFDDTDNEPWGAAGNWYGMGEEMVAPDGNVYHADYIVDAQTAGPASLINFYIPQNERADFAIIKFEILTRKSFAEL